MKRSRFAVYVWVTLAVTLGVILWGDVVQATGSGDGCGAHWPTCNGDLLPLAPGIATFIEFFHRATSGLDFLLVVGLFLWSRRAFPGGNPVRLGAGAALAFMAVESLVGASLVLFRLVGQDASLARAFVAPVHLLNTLLLIGSLALTAWWASGGAPLRWRGQGAVAWALGLGFGALAGLAASGAVTSLGDAIFPVHSTAEAVGRAMTLGEHFLVRLRVLHPFIAVSVGLYLVLAAGLIAYLRPGLATRRLSRSVGVLYLTQLGMGFLNVYFAAPLFTQLPHLLLADLLWINWVLLMAAALAVGAPRREMNGEVGQDPETGLNSRAMTPPERASVHAGTGGATWRDYLWLTKPRVISLLLFTTLAAMLIAAGGWPGGWLFLWVSIGGYAMAGAANAINMVIDRDIDARMNRTAKRPTVTHKISSRDALIFASVLMVGAFVVLWWAANLLTALLALSGLLWYVLVYTLYMKRRFWNNIVIGGAAGAFPPLVGWAAVTNDLSLFAIYLFAIIFFWTPVHFWALSLLIKDDYARVGVPMLPVVLGERVTVVQIGLYAILTALISLMPLLMGELRLVYLLSSLALNGLLLLRSLQLYLEPVRPRAVSLYKYSMLYLALLFVAMAVDRSL
ncbi:MULTISPECIES: heme o synthase [unclassified Meiothermus]|uniref:heme o synthase n=1 Tax=unclassified Meiothermus TaxID=370471 RepID=UPI000D7C77BB|nr:MULTISPECIES: heme o synthase [unclassified Meiothermus]PZA07295.1 protoheme IX farnesyltransferase [Meiothermus sp. Pnk-1]RYM38029.1 protoheme IX farnesyltransferase [Meiothermus sp. PNK-Is4]